MHDSPLSDQDSQPRSSVPQAAPTKHQTRTSKGRKILEEVRDLVPLLRSEGQKGEQMGELTPEVLQALNKAGVFRITLPVEFGGSALGVRDTVEIISEVARGDGSPAWLIVVSSGVRAILGFPQQAIDEVLGLSKTWVGPLLFGASAPVAGGSARKVDGGWMISGKWPFGSGCKHAAWGTAVVTHPDEQGHPRPAMALLPRDQVKIVDDWQVMGLRGTSSNSATVDGEAFVPDHRFVDFADAIATLDRARGQHEGIAFRYTPLGVLPPLGFASLALGMARGALDCFVDQAKARKPFNLPYPTLAETPSVQMKAGEARAMINAARAIIHHHADEADQRALRDDNYQPNETSELTMDVVYAIKTCSDVINMLQVALGSSTLSLNNPIQRFVRDIRVLTTHGALRYDPMAEINGRLVFGLAPFPLYPFSAPPQSPGQSAPPGAGTPGPGFAPPGPVLDPRGPK